jgi:hypothetical protein
LVARLEKGQSPAAALLARAGSCPRPQVVGELAGTEVGRLYLELWSAGGLEAAKAGDRALSNSLAPCRLATAIEVAKAASASTACIGDMASRPSSCGRAACDPVAAQRASA